MIHHMSRPAIARINLGHLSHNYRILTRQSGNAQIMAIVKANAYGHGLSLVAPVLLHERCRSFGVSDAQEGARLRNILDKEDATGIPEIALLSGIFDRDDAELAIKFTLIPVITELRQVDILQKVGFRDSVWIKVDTGMNRLGSNTPEALLIRCNKYDIGVRGIMSHLSCADTPGHPLNSQQTEKFLHIRTVVAAHLPASLLNSAGMVSMPDQSLEVVRPGIALYGSEPIADQPLGLKPVMRLSGAVMQIREIPTGAAVSYGATFKADKTMHLAVVSLGYADGLPRALSNRGHAFFNGKKLDIVGRVCMDYTMLDVTDIEIHQGDVVEFWGEHILINDVARSLDTISYTLFTGVGVRVPRLPEHSG